MLRLHARYPLEEVSDEAVHLFEGLFVVLFERQLEQGLRLFEVAVEGFEPLQESGSARLVAENLLCVVCIIPEPRARGLSAQLFETAPQLVGVKGAPLAPGDDARDRQETRELLHAFEMVSERRPSYTAHGAVSSVSTTLASVYHE